MRTPENEVIMRYCLLICTTVISLTIMSCTPIKKVSGYVPIQKQIDQLKTGFSTKNDVLSLLGEPLSYIEDPSHHLLYVQQKVETVAFWEPKVSERTVVKLSFNEAGVLNEVKSSKTRDNREFITEKEIIISDGRKLTFWQQMFGNIGNFSAEQFLD